MEEKISSYKKRIIKELYFGGLLSCSDLSERVGRSLPLTTKMLNSLLEESLVIERGYAASTGGRKPVMYSLKPDIMYVVAVAMDQLVTKIVLMDMANNYVTDIMKFNLPLTNNANALSQLAENIGTFINSLNIEKNKIVGVGIGMPGFIDVKKGVNYTFLSTDGTSINQYISRKINLPVFIDNDSSLIALAELRFGAARDKKNAMVINASWGVGLGIIVNGELFRGHNGFAGEFSHIPLFLNNKLCSCGKSGCLETESSLLVVIEKAQKELKEGKASLLKKLPKDQIEQACEAIIEAANKGDKLSVELLSEAGYNIGRGVAILIHILNPEIVVLSGRGSSAGRIWQAPIQQALNEHCIPRLCANTEIKISSFGYHAELIGAGVLVMEHFEKGLKHSMSTEIELNAMNNA
jgi:predicted NBD/HSP70 family sugar kinase